MEGVEAFGRQAVLDDIFPAIDKYFQKKEQDSGKAGKSPLWKLMNSLHIPVLDAFLTFVDVEKGVLEGVKSSIGAYCACCKFTSNAPSHFFESNFSKSYKGLNIFHHRF